jgi:hypothetical protein
MGLGVVMITVGVNYVRNPHKAKELTRAELITETNRLERLADIYSDRDYDLSNEYQEQARVLDMILLDQMVDDDNVKRLG